jgi:hypothetical protein
LVAQEQNQEKDTRLFRTIGLSFLLVRLLQTGRENEHIKKSIICSML